MPNHPPQNPAADPSNRFVMEKVREALAEDPAAAAKKKALLEERYVFRFEHTDKRGQKWEGNFTHVIPTLAQRGEIGALRAHLNRGVLNMDPDTDDLHARIAYLDVTLVRDGRPDWASDFTKLLQASVIHALYAEVQNHERTFLG
jgi:hypothetical protein